MIWQRDSQYVWRSGEYHITAAKVNGEFKFTPFYRNEPIGKPVMFADEAKQMAARHEATLQPKESQ